jgi:hypothetical protein
MMRGYNNFNQRARGSFGRGRGGRSRPYQYRHERNYTDTERDDLNLPTGRFAAEKLSNWKQYLDNWPFRVTTPRVDGLPGMEVLIPLLNTVAEEATQKFKDTITSHIDNQQQHQQTRDTLADDETGLVKTIVAIINKLKDDANSITQSTETNTTVEN